MKRLAFALLAAASCAGPAVKIDLEPFIAAEDAHRADAPALVSAVASSIPAMRAQAAVALGRILTPACLDPLFTLATDRDASVRRQAAFALGQYGWKAEFSGSREAELMAHLEPMLSDPDRAARLAAVEAVGKTGLDRVPVVIVHCLRDSDPEIRAEAILALFRARAVLRMRNPKAPPPETPQDIIDRLRELTTDASVKVRRNVAYYFAKAKDIRGLEPARTLSQDSDLWTRFYAVMALAKGGPSGADAIVSAAGDPEYLVRLAAVQSLGSLKLAVMIPPALVKDPSFHVRAAVADAIAASEGDDMPLETLLADSSASVQGAAVKAIAKRRREWSGNTVRTALKDARWPIRVAGVEALGLLGPWPERMLIDALKDPDERVRAATIEALGALETEESFKAVVSALDAEGLAERATAVDALKGRREPEALAKARLCYDRSSNRKWIEVREGLVDLFASREGGEGTACLQLALRDPAPSVAAKARRALVERGVTGLPPVVEPERSHSLHEALRFQRNPVVVLKTTRGEMEIECLAAEAPIHTANFVGLVKTGFYDGLLWHRVVPAFVIQGGDPMGNGWGDGGYSIRAEINPVRYDRGSLGMPRSEGFDTGSCQLFFTHVPTPHLDGLYTVFGRVVRGLEVIDLIEVGDKIEKATVRE